MKKLISLLAFLIFTLFYSQEIGYTIIYKVTYIPQKEVKTEKVEYMALKVKDFKSKFYNLDVEKLDSLVAINDASITDDIESPNLKFTIYKDLNEKSTIVFSFFNQSKIVYKEIPVKYKLINTKPKKIENYNINEALADFGDRNWTILYTPDIPIFDGPYVFSGLPGLVYKAFSKDLDYVFELVSITNSIKIKPIEIPKENVEKEIYAKKLQDFKNDPAHHDILYKNIWGDIFHYKYKGQTPEEIKKQEESFKKIIEKYNNPIDKDVFLLNF